MLEFFRQHVGGIFGIAIVALLALAFTLSFGSQSAGWGKSQSERFAATVDGVDIPENTLKYAFALRGGRNSDQNEADITALQISALRGLVERRLLLNMAEDLGISASTDEAENRILESEIYLSTSLDVLSKQLESNFFMSPEYLSRVMVTEGHRVRHTFNDQDGKFDLEMYKKFVRYHLQLTEEAFVEQQRLEIVAERMRQLLMNSVRVSESEIRQTYDREADTATIEYIRLMPSSFANTLNPTKADLTEWASNHADEIKQYYETNKFKYTNVEKMVRARHILIKVEEGTTEAEKAGAKQKITRLLARARAGADFAALARDNSEDAGSAVKGGDLGFNPRGKMVPEFDDAMFAAAPGTITDIVETKYGFHVIKVEGIREGNISIEDATFEIADTLYRELEGERLAKETGESFLAKLKAGKKMDDLIKDAEGQIENPLLNLKVITSQPFNRATSSIPGIGEAPEVAKAAFELTDDSQIPGKVFEIRSDYYVVRRGERNTPSDEEFAKKKEQIATRLLSMKQGSWLRDQLVAMTQKAENDGRIEYLIGQSGLGAPSAPRETDEPSPDTGEPQKPKAATESAPVPAPADEGEKEAADEVDEQDE